MLFFASSFLLINIGAPWPIAFRLRGQDPLLILALGDLQWARGPFLSDSFSLLLGLVLLSQVVERDPSYPPLADGPSLPTLSRIGRMASRQEGGGRNLFPTFGWSTRSPFSRRSLAFVFFVLCVVCGLSFDNLRVLLARVFFQCFLQEPGC